MLKTQRSKADAKALLRWAFGAVENSDDRREVMFLCSALHL